LGEYESEYECSDCGWTGKESELKTIVGDRADCSYGEMTVCPECESDDVGGLD
jgi:membrane protease subunit (stomatin/prohibitin family)